MFEKCDILKHDPFCTISDELPIADSFKGNIDQQPNLIIDPYTVNNYVKENLN